MADPNTTTEKVATLNKLIAEIDRPFWRQAAFARLDELTAELDDLRHDIERHVAVLSAEVTESERLRQQLAEERKAREELVSPIAPKSPA